MSKLRLAIAIWGGLAVALPTGPVAAASETIEAKDTASSAAAIAREDLAELLATNIEAGPIFVESGPSATGERDGHQPVGSIAYLYAATRGRGFNNFQRRTGQGHADRYFHVLDKDTSSFD